MKSTMIAACVAAATMFAAGTAAAGGNLLDVPASAQGETIGPAAGKAKPYFARADMTCNASTCFADFGKKNGRVRTIRWMTCGIVTIDGTLQVAGPVLNQVSNAIAYMDVTSRALVGAYETAIFTFMASFEVPAGDRLLVFANTSGDPTGGQCTLSGTIE